MTVRELIEGLLDFPMEATVRLNINKAPVSIYVLQYGLRYCKVKGDGLSRL